MKIPYTQVNIIEYEGTGNRTPVLDLSGIENITRFPIQDVRSYLEKDVTFRHFLQEKGQAVGADSVMMYYRTNDANVPFVTFIGEPGASLQSPFSDMCGNGIRALALHIFLSEERELKRNDYLVNGITIYAGEPRTIRIENVDLVERSGSFSVDMGPYQSNVQKVSQFINTQAFPQKKSFSNIAFNGQAPDLHGYSFSFGFNGNTIGEPHLTIFLKNPSQETSEVTFFLREMACRLGNRLTFDSWLFPKGVNVNIATEHEGRIFISTHERNLSRDKESCLESVEEKICHCNTLACGTGGAAVANEAVKQGIIAGNSVITVHPGGCIRYEITSTTTIMTGHAKQI